MQKVVVGIISRKNIKGEDEYLLVSSSKDFGEFTGCWYPPGGHMEEGESEEVALMREIKEELEIEIQPIRKIAETEGDVKEQITAWWLCRALNDDFKIENTEIAGAGYFTKNQMDKMKLWPATEKFFNKYIFK